MIDVFNKLLQINSGKKISLSKKEIQQLPIELQYELYKQRIDYFTRDFLDLFLYKHHRRWINHIDTHKNSLLMAPRDHGKSETVGKALVTHKICFNLNIRILFISETVDSVALKSLNQVRHELEFNVELLEFFRKYYKNPSFSFRLRGNTWTQSDFLVNRTKNLKENTVHAAGAKTSITGQHYDLIICDDIISDKSVRVEKQREILREWFSKTLINLLVDTEDSKICVIGTPKHYDDIYKTLEEGNVFSVLRDKAIIEGDLNSEYYQYIIDEKNDSVKVVFPHEEDKLRYKLLWPYNEKTGHGKTIEALLLKKYTMDSIDPGQFTREIQCEILDDDLSLFSYSLLDSAKDIHLSYIDDIKELPNWYSSKNIRYIIQSWDLAVVSDKNRATQRDTDYTVGITFGLDENFNKYLLNIFRDRGLSQYDLKSKIFELATIFNPDAVIIERNAAQDFMVQELAASTNIPIYPHTTTKMNKSDSLRGLLQLWHTNLYNHKIKFPYHTMQDKRKTDIIFNELHRYGSEKHDDTIMSIWFTLYFISNSELMKAYRETHAFQRPTRSNRPQIQRGKL
jgi:phage terminase large subunit-like protein